MNKYVHIIFQNQSIMISRCGSRANACPFRLVQASMLRQLNAHETEFNSSIYVTQKTSMKSQVMSLITARKVIPILAVLHQVTELIRLKNVKLRINKSLNYVSLNRRVKSSLN